MEAARAQGKLRTNSFARFHRILVDEDPAVEIEDLGNADAILNNRRELQAIAEGLVKRGILPTEDGWGGWLGRYQSALHKAAADLKYADRRHVRGRSRDRSRGR
jgi:hypothetical protein